MRRRLSSGNRFCVDVTQIAPSFDGSIPDLSSGTGILSLSDKSMLKLLVLIGQDRNNKKIPKKKKAKRINALLGSTGHT